MRKSLAIFIIVLLLCVFLYAIVKVQYNHIVYLDQQVRERWAQVENVLQRRNDLIPNLVATVKGYAKHEKEIFEKVAEARAKLAGARTVEERARAEYELSGALNRLLMIVENYPQLKASENFLRLQDELAGTENRIAVERMRYNEAVREYNRAVKSIPIVFFMRFLPFDKEKPYFQAEATASKPPKVEF
ncbi:LemA family protein [bacterium]|nr:LemA family protein [bacterium]